jgi:hypothetical protein
MPTEAEIEAAARVYCDEVLELDRKWDVDVSESDKYSCREDVRKILMAAEKEREAYRLSNCKHENKFGSGTTVAMTWYCRDCGRSWTGSS